MHEQGIYAKPSFNLKLSKLLQCLFIFIFYSSYKWYDLLGVLADLWTV